jgi:hypothetical protein
MEVLMADRLKVYIAGPYSKGDVAENVRAAIYTGNLVAHFGHVPFIPHLTHFWHMLAPNDYEFWMDQDEQWLRMCDAIIRLAGESSGADREMAIARELGLLVLKSPFDLMPGMDIATKYISSSRKSAPAGG